MLTDHFDRVVILNLARRPDRRRDSVAAFEGIGEVVDGQKIRFAESIDPTEKQYFRSRGVRGCFLSHLRELKKAQADGVERLLICEDDIEFVEGFTQRAERWLSRFRHEPWGLLYLCYRTPPSFSPLREKPKGSFRLRTTCCYAVHRTLLPALVQFLEEVQARPSGDARGGAMEIDGAYNHFRRQHLDCITYVAIPQLVTQRASSSDIHPGLIDRWRVTRELANRFRAFRRRER